MKKRRFTSITGYYKKKAGLPPGTLVPETGTEAPAGGYSGPSIRLVRYSRESWQIQIVEPSARGVEEVIQAVKAADQKAVVWVHIAGNLPDVLFQHLGNELGIDALTLEDIASNHQRPKIEFSPGHAYMAFAAIGYNGQEFIRDQGDFILGKDYLLSFSNGFGLPAGVASGMDRGNSQGGPPGRGDSGSGDVDELNLAVPFEDWTVPVLERIQSGRGFVRQNGPDYLCYAMLDTVVDRYFGALEQWEQGNEELEDRLLFQNHGGREGSEGSEIQILRSQKDAINQLRRIIWPTREVLTEVLKNESKAFFPTAQRFFKDVFDHLLILQDMLETMRDSMSDLMTLHLSVVSNRLNQIMKVLTILSAIFIPITFVAGVYGMNFQFMPELSRPWAYPVVLGSMAGLAGGLVVYFKRKGWF
ncbi:magnesium/cobalt transporter CorA [Spirochaeta lutea]|uniref:Magnesium transport protein CorA n=1 Tax=Spirochaeta lutea TaxID=1480694 RepID=A0A098QUN0_9SPIO|nr:magnesium/cobalt transporter CorA [Spirochaeta lutea]KGE71565.1 hypothetical protein DC28_09750 [Spirochaeta lutea]